MCLRLRALIFFLVSAVKTLSWGMNSTDMSSGRSFFRVSPCGSKEVKSSPPFLPWWDMTTSPA